MANLASGNMQMQEGLGNISVEDSKFLGGDLKHTHLVKGLDYALLQKAWLPPYPAPCYQMSQHLLLSSSNCYRIIY